MTKPSVSLRRTTRAHVPLKLLKDYDCCGMPNLNFAALSTNPHQLSKVLSYDSSSSKHYAFSSQSDNTALPTCYQEAMKNPCWLEALKAEIDALKANEKWDVVDLLAGKVLIDCKIVYRIKFKPNGEIDRYKCIMAKGFTQQEGVDYMDTFSPMAKMSTICVILALAAINNWHLHQMDVNNAFLHGELSKEIYVKVPEGYNVAKAKILRLKRSIYDLKQASRQWYTKLSDALLKWGFQLAVSDHSLFIKKTDTEFMALLV